jgi:hypothetical protein
MSERRLVFVKPYPVDSEGLPIHPRELDLPQSTLNPNRPQNFNNHHFAFTARRFGRLAISQTFRDLDINQMVMPKDVHGELHREYNEMKYMPHLATMLEVIEAQRFVPEALRYGSANSPLYRDITDELWKQLLLEYNSAA